MKLIPLSLILFITLSGISQPAVSVKKNYGGIFNEYGRAIQKVPGGYVIGGSAESSGGDLTVNRGSEDYWLFKINDTGAIIWQQTFGGTSADRCYDVRMTRDGGYIMAGEAFFNSGQVTGNHGMNDFWIVKVDSLRNIQWQRSFGGNNEDLAYAIEKTTDSGYIITGYTNSTNGDVVGFHGPNYKDVFVVKIDSLGVKQWAKVFGGNNDDHGRGVVQTPDGGYLIAGITESSDGDISSTHGLMEGWLIKLDASGNMLWQKTYGGSENDQFFSIMKSADGNYILTGAVTSRDGDMPAGSYNDYDYWVMKVDGNGNIIWNKKLPSGFAGDYAYKARETNDNSLLIVGYNFVTGSALQGLVFKLTATGVVEWQKTMGSNSQDYLLDIQQTDDGSFIAAGMTNGNNNGDVPVNHSNGQHDVWMIRSTPFMAPPAPQLKPLPSTICSGSSVTAKLQNPPAATTITIKLDNNSLSYSAIDSSFNFTTTAGTHTIQVIYANSFGADTANFNFITILSPVVTISQADTAICSGSSISLTASGASSYSWSPSTSLSATTGNAVTASPTSNTTYIVTGTANGCTGKDSVTISVLPVVTPTITINYTGCPSNSLNFTASITNGGSNPVVGWYVNNTLSGTGTNFTLNNATNGIQVYARLASSIPCAVSPVNSSIVTVNCITTAVSDLDDGTSVMLGPNPAHGKVWIRPGLPSPKGISWQLTDGNGKLILQGQEKWFNGEALIHLNLDGYAKGLYLLLLQSGKNTMVKKIVVQ